MNRSGLILLQAIGALTILPYPFVLLANIMSIAAPKQTAAGAAPFWLMSAYPIFWIALWIISWKAMGRGNVGLAYGLSSIPVVVLAAAVALYIYSWIGFGLFYGNPGKNLKSSLEPASTGANPLVSTIQKTGTDHPTATPVEALRAIMNNPGLVNEAVPGYGTPLKVAVDNLSMGIDGFATANVRNQADMMLIVRSLVSNGAKLAPEELTVQREWRVKLSEWQEPITTSTENPLVWRIVRRKGGAFQLRDDERGLVNKSTRLHGTPLYAALLADAPDLFPELIKAGSRLSADEERDRAASAALKKILDGDLELKRAYSSGR